MTHARFREALALALYDELDADERAALEAHLRECADCRAFSDALREGLGRTGRATAATDDLPAGWRAALQTGLQPDVGSNVLRRSLPLAASFAAGLIVAALVSRAASATHPAPGDALADRPAAAAPFEADARPLPALHRSRPGWLTAALAR
jgi:predicted anti-sigma-YlaC factor YlaD